MIGDDWWLDKTAALAVRSVKGHAVANPRNLAERNGHPKSMTMLERAVRPVPRHFKQPQRKTTR